jgi:hypothetical protein
MASFAYLIGSVIRSVIQNDLRFVRVDDQGNLVVVAGGPVVPAPIYGVGGDGVTLNPFRMVDFRPQGAGGTKNAYAGVSVTVGPLNVGKTYHLFSDQVCWVNKGGAAVVAAANNTALQNGPVYEYIPTTVGVDDHIAVIQDTAGGSLWVSQVED